MGCYSYMCTCGFYTIDYFSEHDVNYDSLQQEMHRHDFLHAGVPPSSAVQPDRESTTSLDLGASCQKSFTHTESDKERLGSLCKTVNKKEYQKRQTCVTDRSVLCGR